MPYPVVMPPAGDFDRLIVIQRKTVTRNALREPVETWNDLATLPAAKVEISGAEDTRADETAATIRVAFVVRFYFCSPLINPRDRLLYNPDPSMPAAQGLIFNISSVIEIGRRAGHQITAWARADQLDGAAGDA